MIRELIEAIKENDIQDQFEFTLKLIADDIQQALFRYTDIRSRKEVKDAIIDGNFGDAEDAVLDIVEKYMSKLLTKLKKITSKEIILKSFKNFKKENIKDEFKSALIEMMEDYIKEYIK